MQAKTTTLNKLSESIGLRIHPANSKVLRVGTQTSEAVMIGDQPLEDVDAFCYLGSNIDQEGGTSKEIKARIGKAQAALTTLGRFWKTRDISLKTKLRIFNSNVKSVFLYGCEAWNASTICIKRIQVFINRCLRRILRIKWTDKISNESLWERTRQIPAGDEIGRRPWRWIGHTRRKPCGSITKNVLDWNPQGKRSRGRPRGTWRRVRDNDVKDSGHTWDHVKRMAQDRERWRGFVDGLYPALGLSHAFEKVYRSRTTAHTACTDDGWFGTNCQYQCHCADSAPCDKVDGSCSSGCHSDWFGPACQYGKTEYLT
ncbi:hypothetical protein ElyMa_000259000 [Elysia marginata]|uniref:DUF6451 domain-containing protein n=1 Tax=Elysia marginata TaxID=1093978 RepID=A0AAV4F3I3_9GAST|nr:hypothetical protein ElyMa_000259000 [Elysia marginata]